VDAQPDLFHPDGDAGVAVLLVAEAKLWCRRCPVQERCLAEALERGEPYGVWGGMDEQERRELLRHRAAARAEATGAGEAAA
jgi:WhiB family redox-sensing transcriptional regulator